MHGLIRLLAIVAVLLLAACEGKEPLHQQQSYVFGTLVDVTVYGEDEARAQQAANEVMQEFQRLHDMLHAWQPSELSELNAAFARGESKAVSPELAAMLQDAAQFAQQSQGLFNPAIGGLVQLWGFHADEFKAALPDEKQLAQWVAANPQMSDIVIEQGRAHSRNKAVRLDLGGYAKGYALDRAAEILRKQGIRNALVNIGGNVLALGQHGKRPWRVGIQHPRKPGALATLELRDGEAIGTSGDYQRYFMLGEKRYCHLIDPRNGRPAEGVQAATVLTRGPRAGVLSDAVSKPLFIAGANGWRAAAQRMNADEAMLVDEQGNIHLTAGLQKRLEFADKGLHVEVLP
ncbi:FAD:protein FMN transferase [Candidatus Ferrigenium straubiae]|jgi:thiamine biosynthesis lipoprotein|uniref:FAD:protein FMN transferase n=1 Tax=Candidatus Ferrigenium straubiae TaxID=2919506 RepID=UPI003F4AC263